MKPRYGITIKLLVWFFLFVSIFYATILVIFINTKKLVHVSEQIVNSKFEISSISKKMIENLLSMEESEKKYSLLGKKEYIQFFLSAQNEYEANIEKVLTLNNNETIKSNKWVSLLDAYLQYKNKPNGKTYGSSYKGMWIPEKKINNWINIISKTRAENEKSIELATRELNRLGRVSAKNGMLGLGVSSVVGLIGILFLSYSMIRPLRELIKGIREVPVGKFTKPIHVKSKDEFGELAGAFNEMAVQLNEEEKMRSDFISMLSHEIRTPLTSIRESVNMIVEEVMGGINERQRKFLKIASVEIGRICDLLNHLMQVSRMESVALKVQLDSLDTSSFVKQCIKNLNHVAEAKQIKLVEDIPKQIVKIKADSAHLQRVFYNLLGNAIKFSQQGGRIIVRVEENKDMKQALISVGDNGPGIQDDEQKLIFNKYYQTKDARDHMDGVGLGLNISKHIIEAHGGSIWVSSKIGEGSTFFFTLPLA